MTFSTESPAELQPLLPRNLTQPVELGRGIFFGLSELLAHRFDLLGSGAVDVSDFGAGADGHATGRHRSMFDQARHGIRGGSAPQTSHNDAEASRVRRLIDPNFRQIDWQRDFKSDHRWNPRESSHRINPDRAPVGADIKFPWELARGQHLPLLALGAHPVGGGHGRNELLREFRNQVLDFIAANPPRFGVNWTCTMDVAIRVVNWLVAHQLFRQTGAGLDSAAEAVFRRSVLEHAQHIADHLEWHEIYRGNHYLANICGLLFAAAALAPDDRSDAWIAFGVQELFAETLRQFDAEGANFEASIAYHGLSAQMVAFALALVLGLPSDRVERLARVTPSRFFAGPRLLGAPPIVRDPEGARIDIPLAVAERVQRITGFCAHVMRDDGSAPQIGDNDSGCLLRLPRATGPATGEIDLRQALSAFSGISSSVPGARVANEHCPFDAWLAKSLARGRLLPPTSASDEAATRCIGEIEEFHAIERLIAVQIPERRREYRFRGNGQSLRTGLRRYAYPTFGIYVLRSPTMHLTIRCGRLAQNQLGAHAHLDQLAIDLQIDGQPVIRDPGTCVYTAMPEQRNLYRSAAAHFVPRIAGREPGRLDAGLFVLPDSCAAKALYFGEAGFAGCHAGFGAAVYRLVTVEDDAVVIRDASLGEPLAPLTASPVPYSPRYGVVNR